MPDTVPHARSAPARTRSDNPSPFRAFTRGHDAVGPTRRAVLAGAGGALALAPVAASASTAEAAVSAPAIVPERARSEPLNAFAARLAVRVDEDALSPRSRHWLDNGGRSFGGMTGRFYRAVACGVLAHPSLEHALPRAAEVERDPLAVYAYRTWDDGYVAPLPDDPDLLALLALHEVVGTVTGVREAYATRGSLLLGVSEKPTRDPALRAVRTVYRFRIAPSRAVAMVHVLPPNRTRVGRDGLITHLAALDAALDDAPAGATWTPET